MNRPADWREYQRNLQRQRSICALRRRLTLVLPLGLVVALTFFGVWRLAWRIVSGWQPTPVLAGTEGEALSKPALARILGERLIDAQKPGLLTARAGDLVLYAQTTIDADLQAFARTALERSASLRGACVVIEPDTGRVLALASKNPGAKGNLCLDASPAASLFKLVTAAAAVEERQFRAKSEVRFRGDPHGMSRSSVNPRALRRGREVTLASAFARSINPVFGELGALELGPEALKRYGERFGFNRQIPFELALEPSHLEIPEGDFDLARVAAGFNRTTTITPVHAALLAAAVATGGRMVEPTLVVRVVDGRLRPLYTTRPQVMEELFSTATARELREMMEATVSKGTCRRSLGHELGRRWLRSLEVGGKTGTICAEQGKIKYDWFTGYALEKGGRRRLALAVFQEHGLYLGQKSSNIAGRVIRHYFRLEPKVTAEADQPQTLPPKSSHLGKLRRF